MEAIDRYGFRENETETNDILTSCIHKLSKMGEYANHTRPHPEGSGEDVDTNTGLHTR